MVKWVEKGERSTSYFMNLETARQGYNCIYSLKEGNGKCYKTDDEILNYASGFYSKLYNSSPKPDSTVNKYFTDIDQAFKIRLSDEDMYTCEGLVTLNEASEALKQMKTNKSHGIDGLSVEFYQTFWHLIGPLLTTVFNESYHKMYYRILNGNLS